MPKVAEAFCNLVPLGGIMRVSSLECKEAFPEKLTARAEACIILLCKFH